jgi:tyrosine-protein phosphatase SIW14
MWRHVLTLTRLAAVVGLLLAPAVYARRLNRDSRNFRVVRPGVLYRSGQLTLAGLRRAVYEHGIRTVVNLRDGRTPADAAEEVYCADQEIRFIRLPPRGWADGPESAPPAEENVRAFREVMADPANYPVLVHCFAGTHRTGAFCAVYRMEFEQWSNACAIAEVRSGGYVNLDAERDVLGFLKHYRPSWVTRRIIPAPDSSR